MAQVSRSTVSYVLSGRKYVSPETRKRVEEAITELDFTVNARARALATSRTMTLGIVLSFTQSQNSLSLSTYMMEASEQARLAGYRPLLLTGDPMKNIREITASGQVDGLLLFDIMEDDPRIDAAYQSGVPTVLVGMPRKAIAVDAVDLDFSAAGALAIDDIVETGASSIAIVGQPSAAYEMGLTYAHRFRDSARKRAGELGARLQYHQCEKDPEAIRGVLAGILADPTVDGLIIHNDGALRLLSEMLLRVPRPDLEIVMLGPRALSIDAWFPYAAIGNAVTESAQIAVDLLISRLDGAEEPAQRILIPPEITKMPGSKVVL